MIRVTSYQCEGCSKLQTIRMFVFSCIECGHEICEDCMYGYATCKDCAKGKTDDFLQQRFEAYGNL